MQNPLISIIIPIFKVEKYLDQCLRSVVNQTYKNLEIILVDDGSPDNSGKIADNWSKKDKRIKVIHKKNGGLSSARNTGLDNCHGDWIAFIDSDDYVALNYIEVMLRMGQKNNVQLINCTYTEIEDNTNKLTVPRNDPTPGIYNVKSFWEEYYNNNLPVALITAWDKLYYKDIFKSIRYKKGIVSEDEQIIYSIIKAASKILVIKNRLYYYRINRKGSIMNQISNTVEINRQRLAIFYDRIEEFLKDGLYKEARSCNEEILFLVMNEYSIFPNKENKKILIEQLNKIKEIFQKLKKNKLRPTKKAYLYIKMPFFICLLKKIKYLLTSKS